MKPRVPLLFGIITIFSVSLPWSLDASSEIYKWVDETGKTHYGDRAPGVKNAKKMDIVERNEDAAPASDFSTQERLERQQKVLQSLQEDRLKREKEQAEAAAKKQEHKKKCARLAAEIKHNEQVSVFYKISDTGERVYYSDSEGDAVRQKSKDAYSKHCK